MHPLPLLKDKTTLVNFTVLKMRQGWYEAVYLLLCNQQLGSSTFFKNLFSYPVNAAQIYSANVKNCFSRNSREPGLFKITNVLVLYLQYTWCFHMSFKYLLLQNNPRNAHKLLYNLQNVFDTHDPLKVFRCNLIYLKELQHNL